jgi:hypothetical protein
MISTSDDLTMELKLGRRLVTTSEVGNGIDRLQLHPTMVLRSSDPVAQLVWLDERVVADDGDDASALVVVAAGVILREPVLGAVGLAAAAREPIFFKHCVHLFV